MSDESHKMMSDEDYKHFKEVEHDLLEAIGDPPDSVAITALTWVFSTIMRNEVHPNDWQAFLDMTVARIRKNLGLTQ
jgi:hypothetical protein